MGLCQAVFIGNGLLEEVAESDDVVEIDEHGVGVIALHQFDLRFVIKFVPLATRLEAANSATMLVIYFECEKRKKKQLDRDEEENLLRKSRKAFSTLTAFSSIMKPPYASIAASALSSSSR